MGRWLRPSLLVLAIWIGAFGIAFAVAEWREDDSEAFDPAQCQAAVSHFNAVADVVLKSDAPKSDKAEALAQAGNNMDEHCLPTDKQ